MTNRRLTTIGLEMPIDFPIVPYEAVHQKVTEKIASQHPAWSHYAIAWNALAYRFLSCKEYNDEFTASILGAGDGPISPERYIQEKALFGFFTTGLAAIENFCYALYAIGAILDSQNFPLTKPKSIDIERTRKQFVVAFAGEAITAGSGEVRWDATRGCNDE